MVRNHDSIGSVLHRQLRILPRDDALQQQLHLRRILQPLHKIPGQTGRMQPRHFRQIESIEHGLGARIPNKSLFMTGRAVAIIHAPCARYRFPVAVIVKIDSKHQRRASRRLRSLDDRPCHVPVVGRIKLLPHGLSPRRRDFFDR